MRERIETLLNYLLAKDYKKNRNNGLLDFASGYASNKVSYVDRTTDRLAKVAALEKPFLIKEDWFGFRRYLSHLPFIFTKEEWDNILANHFVFDSGWISNISSNYDAVISVGFEAIKEKINKAAKATTDEKKIHEAKAMLSSIDSIYVVCKKYQKAANENGNTKLAKALENVPYYAPRSFYEACLFFRILNYSLWLNDNKHVTVGRFDQYMYSYYINDINKGVINKEDALEIIEELFISLNFDADIYPGVQQGDNGQSIVLGGCDEDGNDAYNDLSTLCLEASLELKLIDPKINVRVNKNTKDEIYLLGTKLTSKGLGFPQYSNDDVVIPALVKWGYSLKDARNYVVAACWEFIIPGVAYDVPNIDAVNFPQAIDKALRYKKPASFEEFKENVAKAIDDNVEAITSNVKNIFYQPSPFQSILMDGCIEDLKDISEGSKYYNNMGLHGAGIANGVDAISAVEKCLFIDKSITYEDLIAALDANFVGYEALRKKLLAAPKFGNNNEYFDNNAIFMLDTFASSCEARHNERGGMWRAGTGTAMYYIWYSENMGATADGRLKGSNYAANYSPSLDIKVDGVLSVISSFTKPNLMRVCNGGPLTLEFHDTVFRNEEGISKVAMLVKTFILKGGHQLQLNAVNRDILLDAQAHPEKYPQLIVRVWGWSGYFNELDLCYQNHVIHRLEFLN